MMFKLPKIGDVTPTSVDADGGETHKSAWGYRRLVLGAVAIFLYVGGEVAIGSFLVNYFKEPSIGGLTESQGARLVSFYWGGAMVGRFIGTLTLRMYKPSKVLTLHALAATGLVILTMATSGSIAMWAVIAVGLFNSIMFPTIFTLTLERSTAPASATSGQMCMAICGGGFISVLYGFAVDKFLAHFPVGARSLAFVVPLACYLYVLWFAQAAKKAPTHAVEEGAGAGH
jgi:FHS family L-fucose permease-like MFS transporter